MPGPLTPRAWQVLFLVRHGLSNRGIARELGISPAGAKYHLSEILSRLGVQSRDEAATWRREGGERMATSGVRFRSLQPMLRTKNLTATLDFYLQRLGFTCESRSDEQGWAALRRDSVRLMVAAPNQHLPFDAAAFTGSFYFHVDDAATLWNAVKKHAEICYPMEDFPYGMREFGIYDNNGYLLQFGSPLGEEPASHAPHD